MALIQLNINELDKYITYEPIEILKDFKINGDIFYVDYIIKYILKLNTSYKTITTYNKGNVSNKSSKNIVLIDGYYIVSFTGTINKNISTLDINEYFKIQQNIRNKIVQQNKNAANYNIKICELLYDYVKNNIKTFIIYNYFLLYIIGQYKHIIYENKNKSTEIIKVHSNINREEGTYITHIIKSIQSSNIECLEIGMAFGTSAAYILLNDNTKLTSIDPFQTTQWASNGLKLLQQMNINKRHKLIEKKSYIALPELLEKKKKYDFIFIDGWHTFDYTLLDFFYSDLLLNIGGYIVIDDALHKGVNKCIRYIETNYKHYKHIESPKSFGIYKKIKEDDREWFYHNNF